MSAGTDLILIQPTGEVVDPGDPEACLAAYREVQRLAGMLAEAKRALAGALIGYSQTIGARTVTLPNGKQYVREGGPRKQYRPGDVRAGLRAAGMPEQRVAEIVVETVTVSVNGTEAAKAARANPEYARVLEEASTLVDVPFTVRLK